MPLSHGLVRTPIYRCLIDGDDVFTSTSIEQNEHLEGLSTMTVDVELQNFPDDLVTGTAFRIIQGGLVDGEGLAQFTGTYNTSDATGYPNQVKLSATGPLSALRRAPLSDHDLTGLTDGGAVKAILTACDVDYDSSDIGEFGYTLGAVKPVIWTRGTPGISMIQELDRVFACATMEIGDGRVVRFVYDRVPDIDDASHHFIKGSTATYYGATRKTGDIDSIQNFWQVTGLSYTSHSDGSPAADGDSNTCQAKIWGTAYATNAKLDGYIAPQTFSSDIIQDEGLAKKIAKRLMRWYNREPDTATIDTVNDPRIVPGLVVGLTDTSYGVNTDNAPYLILDVDRTWDFMRLSGIGGDAGEVGTATSGLSVCCGTQQSDGTCVENGSDGSVGSPPSPGFPPVPDFGAFDIPSADPDVANPFGPGCPPCTASTDGLAGSDWEQYDDGPPGPWTFNDTCFYAVGDYPTNAFFQAVTKDVSGKLPISGDDIIQYSGSVSWAGSPGTSVSGGAYLTFGLVSLDGSHDSLMVQYLINSPSAGSSRVIFAGSISGAGDTSGDVTIGYAGPTDFDFFISWDPSGGQYAIQLSNGVDYLLTGTGADLTGAVGSFFFDSFGASMSPPPIDVQLACLDFRVGGGGLTAGDWHTIDGTIDAISGGEVHASSADGSASDAYADGGPTPFDGSKTIVLTASVAFTAPPVGGTDAPITSFGLATADLDHFTGIQVEQDPAADAFPDAAFLYIYVDGSFIDQLDLTYANAIDAWDISITYNFSSSTMDVLWTSSGVGDVTWSGTLTRTADLYPYLGYASGTDIEVDFTAITITVS